MAVRVGVTSQVFINAGEDLDRALGNLDLRIQEDDGRQRRSCPICSRTLVAFPYVVAEVREDVFILRREIMLDCIRHGTQWVRFAL